MTEREKWQKGDRVNWNDRPGPEHRGVVVEVAFSSILVRWETGQLSRIAAWSPWLKRVGSA